MIFESFCSLGTACPVAASMAKYGLRSYSGVFDWLITADFKYVLHYLENDFDDFMLQDNLVRYEGSSNMFRDLSSGFVFMHDKEFAFETEYDKLHRKYEKKIKRFIDNISHPTCFIRMVINEKEIEYIDNHINYINQVIKRHCDKNEIVFLIKKELCIDVQWQSFILPSYPTGGKREVLRSYFDYADDFLDFCGAHYEARKIIQNVAFDSKQQERHYEIIKSRYQLINALCRYRGGYNALQEQDVIIYGAGDVGLLLLEKIRSNCNVVSIIDIYKAGQIIDNIPIIKLQEADLHDKKIIITAVHDMNKIADAIRKIEVNASVISLAELLEVGGERDCFY